MISQQGRVVAIKGDSVVVNIGGVSGCPACDAGQGCGAGIFGRLLRNRKVDIQVENIIGATGGQSVNIGISEHRFLGLVFSLYVWPLLAGLIGVALGFVAAIQIGLSDFFADMAGLVFGILVAVLALLYSRRRLKEFPYGSEVHLLETDNKAAGVSCALSIKTQTGCRITNIDLDRER